MTRGEGGKCGLAGGCAPDLGTVRAQELRTAAAVLDAQLFAGELPNGPYRSSSEVLTAWRDLSGGEEVLVEGVAQVIRSFRPTLLLTFDPRHGSTCHPDHRATGALALEAARRVGLPRERVWLVESTFDVRSDSLGFKPAVAGDTKVRAFDATRTRPGGGTAWDFLIADLEAHPSQMPPELVEAARSVALEGRRVFLGPVTLLDRTDARYTSLCR
jgi:LmbE family N-acetylglucosaminyl deacetylase